MQSFDMKLKIQNYKHTCLQNKFIKLIPIQQKIPQIKNTNKK